MDITATSNFKRRLEKLSKRNRNLTKKIDKQLFYLATNINYPSLKLHKVNIKEKDVWSISVTGNIRIIFEFIKGGILLVDIGSHDDVYSKNSL
jgi:mRNA-degrading endonuclease YafQ of YafQ-DinJ toxin-antitoxin module